MYVCAYVYISGKYIVLKFCVIINPLNFINYEDTGMF